MSTITQPRTAERSNCRERRTAARNCTFFNFGMVFA
jgi:hypothetical protein